MFFYHVRDDANRPIATVCLAPREDGKFARGVALCSPLDNPHKAKGRKISQARAEAAMRLNRSLVPKKSSVGWIRKSKNEKLQNRFREILTDDYVVGSPEAELNAFETKLTAPKPAKD